MTTPTNFSGGMESPPIVIENGRFIVVALRNDPGRFRVTAYDVRYDYDAGTFTSVTETDIFNRDGSTGPHVNHNALREVWHFPDENAFVAWGSHNKVSGDAFPNHVFLRRMEYDGSGITAGLYIEHTDEMAEVGEDATVGCPTSLTANVWHENIASGAPTIRSIRTKSINLTSGGVSAFVNHLGTFFQPGTAGSHTFNLEQVWDNGSGSSSQYLVRVSSTGTGSLSNAWYQGTFTGAGLGSPSLITSGSANVPAPYRSSISRRVVADPSSGEWTGITEDGDATSDPFVMTTGGASAVASVPVDSANSEIDDFDFTIPSPLDYDGRVELGFRRGATGRRLRRQYTYPGMVAGRTFWLGSGGSTTANIGYPVTASPGYWFFFSSNWRLLRLCEWPPFQSEWRVGRVWWPLGEEDPG